MESQVTEQYAEQTGALGIAGMTQTTDTLLPPPRGTASDETKPQRGRSDLLEPAQKQEKTEACRGEGYLLLKLEVLLACSFSSWSHASYTS